MVKHLPPSIKQLLTLRNPFPLPGPSRTQLQRTLEKTFREAQANKAETGWLVATTCTLLTVNRPPAIAHLYEFVTQGSSNHRNDPGDTSQARLDTLAGDVNKAALIREAALKSTIFVGVPRVILGLAALNQAVSDQVRSSLRSESRRIATQANIDSTIERGTALWDSIYTPHAEKLYKKLGSYHPDFISFIIQSYGSVLAPLPGRKKAYWDQSSLADADQGNLSRAMGSVVGIACLRAEERVVPQLTSHVFGLLKARYVADLSEEDRWLSSDEGTEWILRIVDQFLDTISQG